jgi:hypothetical protein
MQPCYGELDWPDEYSKIRFLREEFLNAVARYEPKVCETLYGEPLILFGRLHREQQTLDWEKFGIAADHPSGAAVIDSLLNWSRDWRLDADWCREAAYESLAHCYCADSSASISLKEFHYRFDLPTRLNLDMTLPPPEGLKEYWPHLISRAFYLEQVDDHAEAEIHLDPLLRLGESSHKRAFVKTIVAAAERYCVKVEKYLEKQGYTRPKRGAKRNLTQHLEWAVMYQIKGLGWSQIARLSRVKASSVQKQVVELLNFTGLSPRSIRKGRPHGSKSSLSTSIKRKPNRV